MLLGAVVVVTLAAVLTLLAIRLEYTPEPPREHLHETDDGERANPFADLSEGAAANTARCRECGDAVESRTYRICGSCLGRSLPGD